MRRAEPAKPALSAKPKKKRRKKVDNAPKGVEDANIARYFLQSARGRFVFRREIANAIEVGTEKCAISTQAPSGCIVVWLNVEEASHLCGGARPERRSGIVHLNSVMMFP